MKINSELHSKISKISIRFFLLAILLLTLFFAYGSIVEYFQAKSILADGETVDAVLVFDGVSDETDPSLQRHNYTYTITVNNVQYAGKFFVFGKDARQYDGQKTIKTVYSRSNPANANRLSILEANTNLAEVAKTNGWALFGFVAMAFFLHVILTFVLLTPKKQAIEATASPVSSPAPEIEASAKVPPAKKSFGYRFLSFLIKAGLVVGVIYFFGSLQSEIKDNFKNHVLLDEKQKCKTDAACLANLEAKFEQCVEDNSSSHKSGKYKRSYTLDQEGFDECIDWRPAGSEVEEASSSEEEISPVDTLYEDESEESATENPDAETDSTSPQESAESPN